MALSQLYHSLLLRIHPHAVVLPEQVLRSGPHSHLLVDLLVDPNSSVLQFATLRLGERVTSLQRGGKQSHSRHVVDVCNKVATCWQKVYLGPQCALAWSPAPCTSSCNQPHFSAFILLFGSLSPTKCLFSAAHVN